MRTALIISKKTLRSWHVSHFTTKGLKTLAGSRLENNLQWEWICRRKIVDAEDLVATAYISSGVTLWVNSALNPGNVWMSKPLLEHTFHFSFIKKAVQFIYLTLRLLQNEKKIKCTRICYLLNIFIPMAIWLTSLYRSIRFHLWHEHINENYEQNSS